MKFLLENVDPDEREDGAKAIILYNGLKFSTSSGLILLIELLPVMSFGKLKGDFSVTFLNHLWLHLFFSCAANLQKLPVLVKGKVDNLNQNTNDCSS